MVCKILCFLMESYDVIGGICLLVICVCSLYTEEEINREHLHNSNAYLGDKFYFTSSSEK